MFNTQHHEGYEKKKKGKKGAKYARFLWILNWELNAKKENKK